MSIAGRWRGKGMWGRSGGSEVAFDGSRAALRKRQQAAAVQGGCALEGLLAFFRFAPVDAEEVFEVG